MEKKFELANNNSTITNNRKPFNIQDFLLQLNRMANLTFITGRMKLLKHFLTFHKFLFCPQVISITFIYVVSKI